VTGDSDHIVAETAARIFADHADPQTINRAKDDSWKAPLWRALAEGGLTRTWVPEHVSGAGASMADGFEVLRTAGRFALPVPLAETLAAGWLLAQAGIDLPDGAMTVAPARPQDRIEIDGPGKLHGRASGVPFAQDSSYMAVLVEGRPSKVALVETAQCRTSNGRSLAGEPANIVTFNGAKPLQVAPAPEWLDRKAFMLMGATIRATQTAGALESILDLSVAYANERVAFERKIGKFQAVQQNLARLAGETAAALAVAGSAADAIANAESFDEAVMLEAASAKIRCAEAATEGAAIAHQVFGAIGFTNEHVLHRFTLRMLGWRDDFGNESWWAAELGKHVARLGADEFWPVVSAR